ncbi:MAG: hypothetical protein AAB368_05485, partial [bacterium]
FARVIALDRGDGEAYGYPHSIFLSAGFYFGWIPALVLLAGLLTLVARMLGDLLRRPGLVAELALIGFGAQFVFMQCSGDFSDYLVALAFAAVWLGSAAKHPATR